MYDLARRLNILDDPSVNAETACQRVIEELTKQDHWLMVLDNVDDAALISRFLPAQRDTRHVLITTRYNEADFIINGFAIPLEIMTESEAGTLFANMYCSDNQLERDEKYRFAVIQLITELGFLPLAIIQAAAYLRQSQEDILNYVRMYRETRKAIWDFKPIQGDYVSIAAVMALSFEKIKDNEETVRLFCLITFFSPNNIPEFLLTSDPRLKDETLRRVFQNKGNLNKAIGPLCAYSFVKRSSAQQSFSIHPVVQDVMRDIIDGQIKDEGNILEVLGSSGVSPSYWIERAVETLVSAYPDSNNPDTWKVCEIVNPHAFVSIERSIKYNIRTDEMVFLYLSIGIYEINHGNCDSAKMLFLNALPISEEIFGVDHINTADTINNLGITYSRQGKYDEAIAHYERSLRIYEKAFGVDHINTADTINNLGSTY